MKIRTMMLATAGTMTLAMGGTAVAATKHKAHHKAAGSSANAQLMEEIRALKSQVEQLQSKVDGQATLQTQTASQIEAQQAQITATQSKVDTSVAQVAVQQADIGKRMTAAEHPDKFHFKGITITPGGFLELAGIYRDHFQGNDISSSFAVNFPNSRQYYQHEGRFTARQSRLSFLAQGNVNKDTVLSMYGEFDFQGAAQTANSNGSNSYNPRIRNLYGTIDWNRGDYGIHLLAGQNWSLVTMQSKGITPRSEVTPPQIDAQYIPGFAWARQPGVRLTGDFLDHKLWIAVSAENPQNNSTVPVGTAGATEVSSTTGGSGFNSLVNNSFSDMPDFIGKVAYENTIAGHTLHVEGFGIVRKLNERLITGTNTGVNNDVTTFGYGGSINLQVVPKILDVQFSGFGGKGIGRYGSAGLSDAVFSSNGRIHPIEEFMLLGGATLHASKQLDVYAFAGEEQEDRTPYATNFGAVTADNSGCFIEGGTCGGNTRRIRQLTGGFWDKFYQGPFGRAQVGIQVSYTERQLFEGSGHATAGIPAYVGYPQAHNTMGFVAFRYYPF